MALSRMSFPKGPGTQIIEFYSPNTFSIMVFFGSFDLWYQSTANLASAHSAGESMSKRASGISLNPKTEPQKPRNSS